MQMSVLVVHTELCCLSMAMSTLYGVDAASSIRSREVSAAFDLAYTPPCVGFHHRCLPPRLRHSLHDEQCTFHPGLCKSCKGNRLCIVEFLLDYGNQAHRTLTWGRIYRDGSFSLSCPNCHCGCWLSSKCILVKFNKAWVTLTKARQDVDSGDGHSSKWEMRSGDCCDHDSDQCVR